MVKIALALLAVGLTGCAHDTTSNNEVQQMHRTQLDLARVMYSEQRETHAMIFGQVEAPGAIEINGERSLSSILAEVGLTGLSSKEIHLRRGDQILIIDSEAPEAESMIILPGDIIYIDRSLW